MQFLGQEISGCVFLAPMAGVTDYAFRTICGQLGAAVTVTDSKGSAVADTALVGTGQTLTIQDASSTVTYTCLVYGDADGDGRITAVDLYVVKEDILQKRPLSGAAKRAASLSGSKITAVDLYIIKNHILKKELIVQR